VCEACAVAAVAIADVFGICGRRDELVALLERFGRASASQPGCNRYTFAPTLDDPDTFVLVSEWDNIDALDAHYRSQAFADFQFELDGLLARPSELSIYEAGAAVRPLNTRPMDPRDAD
jgi:quinol monooxygenase YgiN